MNIRPPQSSYWCSGGLGERGAGGLGRAGWPLLGVSGCRAIWLMSPLEPVRLYAIMLTCLYAEYECSG